MGKIELHREYPDPREAELSAKMVRLVSKRMPAGSRLRGQHAKTLACVHAVFTIRDDLAERWRHGIFKQPGRAFPALLRFSNGSAELAPDRKPDARGLALRLFEFEGGNSSGLTQKIQDFLFINHPVFPFATAAEMVRFFQMRQVPLLGNLLAVAWLAIFHGRHLLIARDVLAHPPAPLLAMTFWSASPYWLGCSDRSQDSGQAVKYSLVPRDPQLLPPLNPQDKTDDYLGRTLAQYLKSHASVFDFRIQVQTDPVTMPIEDATILWDEKLSPPLTLATLTLPMQDVDSPAGREWSRRGEAMAFSPSNALAEHRPMGGINRLRQSVYLASQARRGASGSSACPQAKAE